MVVAGRRRRRPRWLVLALVLSFLVLAVNALASSRSDGAGQRLAELAYLDEMRPHIERSTEQGADLADVRATALQLGRDGLRRRLERVGRESAAVADAVRRFEPPNTLADAHSLLRTTMLIRARAAERTRTAMVDAVSQRPIAPAVQAMVEAGEDMAAADRTYEVFLRELPDDERLTPPPRSRWVRSDRDWSEPDMAALVASLRSSALHAPVHDVSVLLVTTDPAPVGTDGSSSVLPPTKTLNLEVVVANVGNERETDVPVMAVLEGTKGMDTVREFVDLAPGQRQTVVLSGLRPNADDDATLTVRVGPIQGESKSGDNEHVKFVVVRG
jgi:hypothetical protein